MEVEKTAQSEYDEPTEDGFCLGEREYCTGRYHRGGAPAQGVLKMLDAFRDGTTCKRGV
jgi:hypothetical protein